MPSTILVVRGEHSLPLEILQSCGYLAKFYAEDKFSGQATIVLAARVIENASKGDSGHLPVYSLPALLRYRRDAKASDPRNIVFSLLGLFDPIHTERIHPDYSLSVKDVFTAAARHIIRLSGGLEILCSVESPKHSEGGALPTWVPDCRAAPETYRNVLYERRNTHSQYLATRGSRFNYDPCTDTDDLRVLGVHIGTIKGTRSFNETHCVGKFNLPERYTYTDQPILTALRQAQSFSLCYAFESLVPVEEPNRGTLANFFDLPAGPRQECTQCSIAHPLPNFTLEMAQRTTDLARIVRRCEQTAESRAFITTDSSHLGFGPKGGSSWKV